MKASLGFPSASLSFPSLRELARSSGSDVEVKVPASNKFAHRFLTCLQREASWASHFPKLGVVEVDCRRSIVVLR